MTTRYKKASDMDTTPYRRGTEVPGIKDGADYNFDLGDISEHKGIASPSTDPGTPSGNCVYSATQAGTYTHFDGLKIWSKGIYYLVWNGTSWSLRTLFQNLGEGVNLIKVNEFIYQEACMTLEVDCEYSAILTVSTQLDSGENSMYQAMLPIDGEKIVTMADGIIFSELTSDGKIRIVNTDQDYLAYVDVVVQYLCPNAEIVSADDVTTSVVDGNGESPDAAYSEVLLQAINDDLTPMLKRLDALEYIYPEILSFTHDAGVLEIGATISSVRFDWTLNKEVKSINLQYDGDSTSVTSKTTWRLQRNFSETTKVTLVISDETNNASLDLMVYFRHYMHWGVASSITLDSDAIQALSSKAFATTSSRTATFDCTGGKYIYFAYPKSFGNPTTIKVNGLAVSAWEISEVSHTNSSGSICDYYVYRSTNLQTSSAIAVEIIK